VPHEDVRGQIQDVAEVGHPLHLLACGQHVVAVSGEVQVRTADAACLHRDQHLAGAGYGLRQIVAVDHPAAAQHRSTHQACPR
jgi:hypothetical protein